MILNEVQIILKNLLKLDVSKLVPDARFMDDLGVDSLDIVEIVMALEDHFDLEIPDEEAKQWRKIQDVCSYIESNKP